MPCGFFTIIKQPKQPKQYFKGNQQQSTFQAHPPTHRSEKMTFFKRSNKIKVASVVSTAATTPPVSKENARPSDINLTREQAIYKITNNKLNYYAALVCVR